MLYEFVKQLNKMDVFCFPQGLSRDEAALNAGVSVVAGEVAGRSFGKAYKHGEKQFNKHFSEASNKIGGAVDSAQQAVGDKLNQAKAKVGKWLTGERSNINNGSGPNTDTGNSAGGQSQLALPETIAPSGFRDADQFKNSMNELNDIVKEHGITDAKFRVRGSSTTGFSQNPHKKGKFFDDDGPSDIDLGIESEQLEKRLTDAGKKPSQNVPGLFLPKKIRKADPNLADDLDKWQEQWSDILGREIEPAANAPGLVEHSNTDIIYKPK